MLMTRASSYLQEPHCAHRPGLDAAEVAIIHRVLVEDVASATANGAREGQPVRVRAAQLAQLGCLNYVV